MTDMAAPAALADAYARAFHGGDTDRLREIFMPDCKLQFVDGDGLRCFEAHAWIDLVAKRPSQASQGRALDYRLVSVHMAGPGCAAVALEMAADPGDRFSDVLHLLRIGGAWKIVAKSFAVLPVTADR